MTAEQQMARLATFVRLKAGLEDVIDKYRESDLTTEDFAAQILVVILEHQLGEQQ